MRPRGDSPRNLLTSLLLVFPLFLVYQVGVLFTLPMLNGADFLTTLMFRTLGLSVLEYLGFLGVVVAIFMLAVALLRRRQRFNAGTVLPVVLESSVYALTMGSLIMLVMTRVLGISPQLAVTGSLASEGAFTRVVMSLGAGVYEETVFRLGLLGGLAALLQRAARLSRWSAVALGFLVSALTFAAMHHLPPYGDPLRADLFTFRALAGICFGLLYWFRSFAVAVYTHSLYDLYVLIAR